MFEAIAGSDITSIVAVENVPTNRIDSLRRHQILPASLHSLDTTFMGPLDQRQI